MLVARTGGLSSGKHRIDLAIRYRVSYLPFVPTTRTGRDLTLAA